MAEFNRFRKSLPTAISDAAPLFLKHTVVRCISYQIPVFLLPYNCAQLQNKSFGQVQVEESWEDEARLVVKDRRNEPDNSASA